MNTTNETIKELATMTDRELVAYWNILQMGGRCLTIDSGNKTARHTAIISSLLVSRGIAHEAGKLTKTV